MAAATEVRVNLFKLNKKVIDITETKLSYYNVTSEGPVIYRSNIIYIQRNKMHGAQIRYWIESGHLVYEVYDVDMYSCMIDRIAMGSIEIDSNEKIINIINKNKDIYFIFFNFKY